MPERRPTDLERRIGALEQGHTPCPGPALRTDMEVVKEQVVGLRRWEGEQNGKLSTLAEKLDESRVDRQRQIDNLQKQVSDNHTEVVSLLAARDRQMFMLLVTATVSLVVSMIVAVVTFGIKVIGGGA